MPSLFIRVSTEVVEHMKYVMFQHKRVMMPVLLPDHIPHNAVELNLSDTKIVSAGFYSEIDGVWKAHGKSTSLGIKSKPRRDTNYLDAARLNCGTMHFLRL